ncbi:hypothetical protein LCGC14_1388000 [marine sediment metagenome]|uniref:Uncharacterized protein n=1 Tax=marine sediment metagenome TaxID=412755 RepID=A0A0F9K0S9_9ZZZZ
MPTTTMSVRLDEKLKSDLSAWAAATHRSVNEIITRLVKTEIDQARANLDTELETAKAEVKYFTALSMKFLDKAPGEKLTLKDFAEDELGRDHVEDLMTLDDTCLGSEDYRDGVDRKTVEGDLAMAKWRFGIWSVCMEKLGQEPPDLEIVNHWGYITPETRKRVRRIEDHFKMNSRDSMGMSGYKSAASWWNVLNGYNEISPRARTRLADWLEYNEAKIGSQPEPPKLTVV